MKSISLLAALIAGVLASGLLAAEGPNTLDLDGRELVVRVYKDWRKDAGVFEKTAVQLEERLAIFDFGDLGKFAVVAVLAGDQEDEAVREIIGDRIYGWVYEEGLEFTLPAEPPDRRKDYLWTFKDALGNPLAGAKVEIFLCDYRSVTKVKISEALLDERGHLKVPKTTWGELTGLSFKVSHPDYGAALIEEGYPWYEERSFLVPLVRIGTKAYERSIWGVVVDPQGNPVAGAIVTGSEAYTPGRGRISSVTHSNRVLTDQQGRFAMHLPVKKNPEGGTTIPPVCYYRVSVKAPSGLGLMRYSGKVPNGQETTIVLRKQKEPEKFFKTFAFVDKMGAVTDPNRLKEFIIWSGRTRLGHSYGYDSWKDGLRLTAGTYRAAISTAGLGKNVLDIIEVTAESPQELIFTIGDNVLYEGKVVDGLTGEPISGAFIAATGWLREDFSAITPEQWQLLRELPTNPSGNEPALEPVRKVCDKVHGHPDWVRLVFERVIRSESDGTFILSFDPADKFYQLVVFDQDCLHVVHRRDRFKPDEYNYVQLPESRLYPAARLTIEPNVEPEKRKGDLTAWWYIDEDNNPAWAKDILAYHRTRKASFTDLLRRDLQFNRPQTIQVPAGVNMQIRLTYIGSSRGKKWWCPVFTETFNADQGETVDLGWYSPFAQEMPIYVEVVDPGGEPLEGVGIKHLDMTGSYFGLTRITDANGIAGFTVPPYYKGEFSIGGQDENKEYVKESIFYETNGPEDANNVYTLKVSDEILYHLFK